MKSIKQNNQTKTQLNFLNILQSSRTNPEEALEKIKELLENSEQSKFIHLSDLNQYSFIQNPNLHNYLKEKREEHNLHMEDAIKYDLIDFVDAHFSNWLNTRFNISLPWLQTKENTNLKKALISYVNLAIKNNATQVTQFLLSNEKVLSLFSQYPYNTENMQDFGNTAYINNNVDIMFFLLQSTKILNCQYQILFDKSVILNHVIDANTFKFTDSYENNIKHIEERINYFIDAFTHNPFHIVITEFENFLSSEPLSSYEVSYKQVIKSFFNHATEFDNTQLLIYLLDSENLKFNANVLDDNQIAYTTSCYFNYHQTTNILLERIYNISKEKDFLIKLSDCGLINAIDNENVATVAKILKYKEIIDWSNSEQFFSKAIKVYNKEILKLMVENSFRPTFDSKITSYIIDQYPYGDLINYIILTSSGNCFDRVKYLLEDQSLNPKSYPNFDLKYLEPVNTKKMFQSLFNIAFLNGQIEILDYLVENKQIYPCIKELINDKLIEHVCSKQIFKVKPTDMIDFLIINLKIPKNEQLINVLDKVINYDNSNLGNNIIQGKEEYKIYSQYVLELYDMIELNENLTNVVDNITLTKNSKKKKV